MTLPRYSCSMGLEDDKSEDFHRETNDWNVYSYRRTCVCACKPCHTVLRVVLHGVSASYLFEFFLDHGSVKHLKYWSRSHWF